MAPPTGCDVDLDGGEIAVRGRGAAGPEVLEVLGGGAEARVRLLERAERLGHGSGERFGRALRAKIDDELPAGDGIGEAEREFGDDIVADEIDGGDLAGEGVVGTEGHL